MNRAEAILAARCPQAPAESHYLLACWLSLLARSEPQSKRNDRAIQSLRKAFASGYRDSRRIRNEARFRPVTRQGRLSDAPLGHGFSSRPLPLLKAGHPLERRPPAKWRAFSTTRLATAAILPGRFPFINPGVHSGHVPWTPTSNAIGDNPSSDSPPMAPSGSASCRMWKRVSCASFQSSKRLAARSFFARPKDTESQHRPVLVNSARTLPDSSPTLMAQQSRGSVAWDRARWLRLASRQPSRSRRNRVPIGPES